MLPIYNLTENDLTQLKDKFYKEIFNMWTDIHFSNPKECEQIVKQIIWFNSHIKIGNRLGN